jgi:hypothetical protein
MKVKIRFCNGHELELSDVKAYDFRGEYLQVVTESEAFALKAPYRNIDYVAPVAMLQQQTRVVPSEAGKTLGLKGKDNA